MKILIKVQEEHDVMTDHFFLVKLMDKKTVKRVEDLMSQGKHSDAKDIAFEEGEILRKVCAHDVPDAILV